MKKILLLNLFLIPQILIHANEINLIGSIEFPQNINPTPNICVYYKGKKLDVESGSFTFRENRNIEKLFLLVSENIEPRIKKEIRNNIEFQQINLVSIHPYKYYLLTKNMNNKAKLLWNIEEIKVEKELYLPENTLIILFNPNFIAEIKEEIWENGTNTYKLPKINIKNIEKEKLFSAASKALLISPDLNAIHSKSEKKELKKSMVKISMRD